MKYVTTPTVEILRANFRHVFPALTALNTVRQIVFDARLGTEPRHLVYRTTDWQIVANADLLRAYHADLVNQRFAVLKRHSSDVECLPQLAVGEMVAEDCYVMHADGGQTTLQVIASPIRTTLTISTVWNLIPLWEVASLRYRTLIHTLTANAADDYTLDVERRVWPGTPVRG